MVDLGERILYHSPYLKIETIFSSRYIDVILEIVTTLAWFAMTGRILLLATERLYLKKLELYDSFPISSLFFLGAALLLTPSFVFMDQLSFELFFQGRNALLSALFYSIGLFLYVKSIAMEDTALIAPLYNSSTLWIFIFGYFFLGEQVTLIRVIGGILIFVGVFFLYGGTLREKLNAIRDSQGSLLMLGGSVFIAIGRTIDAFSIRSADPIFFAFLMNLYLGTYLLIATVFLGKLSIIPKVVRKEPRNLFLASFSNGWAYLFLLVALVSLDLSIAEPLSLLSLIITAILGKYILGERIRERIPGTIAIIVGAILLFY